VDGATYTITDKDNPKMSLSIADSLLTFDLNDEGLWVYVTYDPYDYENIRIDARVTNRGVNNNNVSLICRHTDSGWYEFNIANNGLYWIYAAQVNSDGKVVYGQVYEGGSNKIKSGKETNEYSAICDGRTLSLYINGTEVRTVTGNKYGLGSGQVGISVSSFDTLPVVTDVDWVKISEP
jgi:predicted small secreted protein